MRVPKYRRNPDGRAFVQYRKKRTYLGKHGTKESKKQYREFVAELMGDAAVVETPQVGSTVSELSEPYLAHAESYYGESGEFENVRDAIFGFLILHGLKQTRHLSPSHLREFQAELVAGGYSRSTINSRVSRVKRWLKWSVSRELLPAAVYHAVCTVEGLRAGRSDAHEPPPVEGVPLDVVESTLKHVAPVVATMASVQYLCGMRPDEVCRMRPCDIDMTGEVWLYRPPHHKNAWRGSSLVKAIPLPAQKLLAPWISTDPEAWLFPTRASVEWWSKQVPRKTKVFPYELRQRRAAKRKASQASRRYTSASYGKAIKSGIDRANQQGASLPHWSPNQLRHSIAGEISRKLGQQAAQRWLGHAKLDATAIYAGLNSDELVEIAKALEETIRLAAGES